MTARPIPATRSRGGARRGGAKTAGARSRGPAPWRVLALALVVALCTGCSVRFGGGSGGGATASPRAKNSIPLAVKSDGRATLEIVPVSIDGHGPYKFLLDTGSAISSVDRKLASTLRLPMTGRTTKVAGVAGTTHVPLAKVPKWQVGHLRLMPEKVGVLDLSKTDGSGVDGLLGSDELRRLGAVTVDFAQRRLVVAHPAQPAPAS